MYPGKGSFQISTGTYTSSTIPFPKPTREIYSGLGGDLRVIMIDGTTGYFQGLPAGGARPIRAIALSSLNLAGYLQGVY